MSLPLTQLKRALAERIGEVERHVNRYGRSTIPPHPLDGQFLWLLMQEVKARDEQVQTMMALPDRLAARAEEAEANLLRLQAEVAPWRTFLQARSGETHIAKACAWLMEQEEKADHYDQLLRAQGDLSQRPVSGRLSGSGDR